MKAARHAYAVVRWPHADSADAHLHEAGWKAVPVGRLTHAMPGSGRHQPRTEFRLAYTEDAIYGSFRVADRYVRAAAVAPQDAVCRDSCVEFFFTPGPDPAVGYFNFEVNCIGTPLFHFQKRPRRDPVCLSPEDLAFVDIRSTLAGPMPEEVVGEVDWALYFRIPFSVMAGRCQAVRPAPGAGWRANFYKCADECSHPHWLTWSPVDRPAPDFHVPDAFGDLVFGG